MTGLYAAGAVVLFILLIAFMPVGVRMRYDHGFTLHATVWFMRFRLIPAKQVIKKKAEKAKPKAVEEKKEPKKKAVTVSGVIDTAKITVAEVKKLLRGVKINYLDFHMLCASSDAAKTGILFGEVTAAAGVLLPLLEQNFHTKRKKIWIEPDFSSDKSTVTFSMNASVSLYRIIGAGVRLLLTFISARINASKKQNGRKVNDPSN